MPLRDEGRGYTGGMGPRAGLAYGMNSNRPLSLSLAIQFVTVSAGARGCSGHWSLCDQPASSGSVTRVVSIFVQKLVI